jgi:Tfp pilus assembly protein PilX
MVDEAARVVSTVVDLTNKAWTETMSMSSTTSTAARASKQDKTSNQAVSPQPALGINKRVNVVSNCNLNAKIQEKSSNLESDSDSDSVTSFERCANIVDFLIGELDDNIIAPPAQKKRRLLES